MKLPLYIFAALLLSACATITETIPASVLEQEAARIAKEQAGLRYDGPAFGGLALAEAVTKSE